MYERLVVRLLEETGRPEQAEQVYVAALTARRDHFDKGHGDIAMSLFELGSLLLEHEKPVEAQAHLSESVYKKCVVRC
ncbi:MAG: tetratricopeptide repeat protein [Planctomycetes bacterium]|nr:tetratricopeptide repeat protein [Planctomycetota bacterium]